MPGAGGPRPLEQAQAELAAAGLSAEVTQQPSDAVAAGDGALSGPGGRDGRAARGPTVRIVGQLRAGDSAVDVALARARRERPSAGSP